MIDELKPYRKVKASGMDWLGEVPEHWEVKRAKHVLRPVDLRSESGSEELLTVSSSAGVVPRASANVTMFKAESYAGYKLCWPGDLVINSLWAWSRGLGVSPHHGIISTAYGVYRPRDTSVLDSGYLNRLVRSKPFQWELKVRSKGVWTSRLQLTDQSFLGATVPLPPVREQAVIVGFLDHADRRIRRSIRAKQNLIALLDEQKKAIIHHAVTRGLDPNVSLKPSGVEWLGDVPGHWEVLALRRKWSIADCKHLTVPFVESPDGIPLVSVREVQSFEVSLATAKRTTPEFYELLIEGDRRPRKGDLIYCRNVSVGAAAVVATEEQIAMGQDVCLVRSSDENQRYLNYFLRSPAMSHQLSTLMVGSTFNRINVADIKSLTIVVPPRKEQDAIAEWLDGELNEADQTQALAEQEIRLLREYRTRLIADVVTGKLDVRGAAARLPENIDEEDLLNSQDEVELEDYREAEGGDAGDDILEAIEA